MRCNLTQFCIFATIPFSFLVISISNIVYMQSDQCKRNIRNNTVLKEQKYQYQNRIENRGISISTKRYSLNLPQQVFQLSKTIRNPPVIYFPESSIERVAWASLLILRTLGFLSRTHRKFDQLIQTSSLAFGYLFTLLKSGSNLQKPQRDALVVDFPLKSLSRGLQGGT